MNMQRFPASGQGFWVQRLLGSGRGGSFLEDDKAPGEVEASCQDKEGGKEGGRGEESKI